jgi:hypothetical protein
MMLTESISRVLSAGEDAFGAPELEEGLVENGRHPQRASNRYPTITRLSSTLVSSHSSLFQGLQS